MAVNKVPYLKHLKQFGLRESALIGKVAQTTADAIEEQAEQIGALSEKVVSRSVDVTLTVSGWENNRQVIEVEGLTANQNGVIGLSQDISVAERETAVSAELGICDQVDGAFTVAYSGDKPTYDIPITLILLN